MSRRSQSEPPSEGRSWTSSDYEEKPSVDHSQLWRQSIRSTADPEAGLKRLLVNNHELVVTRRLEMLNVFMGFEQSNRYVITNPAGGSLGYIVEEPRGFLSMFARQVFRTHRPFRALVMDLDGSPILWIRRPFSWINSRMFVQRPRDALEGELVLDAFAEVQQEWHLWRRRYNLFLRSTPRRVLTTLGSDSQPEPTTPETHFDQFARVDEGLWAWNFVLRDAQGEGIASVNRAFRGFGREIFTDTGQYTVSFRAPDEQVYSSSQNSGLVLHKPGAERNLTVDERALALAMAINIDYDYFSRHSEGGHGFGFWWSSGE
ncbi:Scramblase-domain-containing protein [Lanmaoa asiatica]|nr:Scramblase-domain-containing protein [Lanmaoa asiatica]